MEYGRYVNTMPYPEPDGKLSTEDFRLQRARYQIIAEELKKRFRDDLQYELSVPPDAVYADKLFEMAWARGDAHLPSVYSEYKDLLELVVVALPLPRSHSLDDLVDQLPNDADLDLEVRYNTQKNGRYQARITVREPSLKVFVARGEFRRQVARDAFGMMNEWLEQQS